MMTSAGINSDLRARNRALQDREIESGALAVQAKPTRVWFALTGRCNLACGHCPRIPGVSSDVNMEADVYSRIRDEVLPLAEEVDFGGNNLGEQMIHQDFTKALTDLHAAGCKIVLITNGTKIDEAAADALATSGVHVRISIEGTGEAYEQNRGFNWQKLMTSLRAFQRAAERHPEAGASLEFAVTVFAGNLDQLPELVKLAKELGAKKIFTQHLLPKSPEHRLQSLFFHRTSANQVFAETERLAAELGVDVTLPGHLNCGSPNLRKPGEVNERPVREMPPCYLPWTSVNILENGDVLPCCVGGSLIMGNLKKNTFEEVWNGPAYRRLRKTVNSKSPNAVCGSCTMRYGAAGATEDTYEILLDDHTIVGRLKTSLKTYLIHSKRKKTLGRLIRARDAVNRMMARV